MNDRAQMAGVRGLGMTLALAFGAGGCLSNSSVTVGGADASAGLDGGSGTTTDASGVTGSGDAGASSGSDGGAASSNDGSALGSGDGGCGSGGGPGSWTCVGAMATARIGAGIAVLPGGKALVAGGWNPASGTLTSAEVFDSASNAFTPTQAMSSPHLWGAYGAGWPQLAGGKVLVAGGLDATGAIESQADIYDPTAGTFTATGSLVTAVISFFPLALTDGSILFIGGWNSTTGGAPTPGWTYIGSGTNEVQRYTPSSGAFADTGPLAEDRLLGCEVVQTNGHVLAIGGSTGPSSNEATIEDYDPTAGTWTTKGTLTSPAVCTRAFVLSNGKILLTGDGSTAGADLLDPTTLTTTPTTGFPAGATPAYVQLQSGDVLAMGNSASGTASAKAYVYGVASNAWQATGDMGEARSAFPPPVLLTTGEVLIIGGSDASGNATASAELYHP